MKHNLETIDIALKQFAVTASKEDFKILCNEVTETKKELRERREALRKCGWANGLISIKVVLGE